MRDALKPLTRAAFAFPLDDAAALRLQGAVNEALRADEAAATPRAVMTLAEVAAYLRVTPAVIEGLLGQLPCFELGGRLLFRREAVDEWIQHRERAFAGDVLAFDCQEPKLRRVAP